jgi:cytidine deaminase
VDGEIAVGANMENACYRLGVCGEIAALTAAQQAFGLDRIARIAVAGRERAGGALAGEAWSPPAAAAGNRSSRRRSSRGRDLEVVSANGDGTDVCG